MNIYTTTNTHPFDSGVLTVERLREAKRLIDSITPAPVVGVRIMYSSLCLQDTDIPAHEYRRRKWQTAAQAARKRKKWIKRWGFVKAPCIFKTPMGYFAHPSFKVEFERALFREQIIRERSVFDTRHFV